MAAYVRVLVLVLSALGVGFVSVSSFQYVKGIVAPETEEERIQPQRQTWLVYTLISIVGIRSAIEGGASWGIAVAVAFAIVQALVCILSIWHGKPGGKPYDRILLGVAIAGIIALVLGILPALAAAIVAVVADLIGTLYTVRDTWEYPYSEDSEPWTLDCIGSSLAALAVLLTTRNPIALLYPVYLALSTGLVARVTVVGQARTSPPVKHAEGAEAAWILWVTTESGLGPLAALFEFMFEVSDN